MNEKIKFKNNAEYIIPFVIQNKFISKNVKLYDVLKLGDNMLVKALLKDGSQKAIDKLSEDSSFDHIYRTSIGTIAIFIVPKKILYLCNIFYKSGESAYDRDMLKYYYTYWN